MSLKTGPLPKHHQLTEILREKISAGELRPNDQFPTEESLCRQYGVSRGTVRRAIDTLVHEGLLRREQGRGTFVAAPPVPSGFFTLTGFSEDMRRQNLTPGTQLLTATTIPASPQIAGRLNLFEHQPVIYIARLRLANGRPVVYETRHLAQSLCPNLLNEDLENQSIHWLLIEKYQLPLIRTTHTMEARVLTNDEASLLETEPGIPAFFVDRLTYTIKDGKECPAVWYQALYRGDQYHFKAEFQATFSPT